MLLEEPSRLISRRYDLGDQLSVYIRPKKLHYVGMFLSYSMTTVLFRRDVYNLTHLYVLVPGYGLHLNTKIDYVGGKTK